MPGGRRLSNRPFRTARNEDGVYTNLLVITNRRRFGRDTTEYAAAGYDRGILERGAAPMNGWQRKGNVLEVRIPWMLLNFTDPSSRHVLQDGAGAVPAGFGTRVVLDIGIMLAVADAAGSWRLWPAAAGHQSVARYHLQAWEQPRWRARVRPTFQFLQAAFENVTFRVN